MSVPGPTVIEFFHSKPFSPTRRLCLGEVRLPADAGCLLVSRIAARFGAAVDRATAEEVRDLWAVLCRQSRADQPRGRYRLQTDRVGLARARDSLVSVGGRPRLVVVDRDVAPVTHLLAALYASAGRRRLLDGFLEGFENPESCNGSNYSALAGMERQPPRSGAATGNCYGRCTLTTVATQRWLLRGFPTCSVPCR